VCGDLAVELGDMFLDRSRIRLRTLVQSFDYLELEVGFPTLNALLVPPVNPRNAKQAGGGWRTWSGGVLSEHSKGGESDN
jgi:hypothetical protein